MSAPTQCRLPLPGSMRESDALEFGNVAEEMEATDQLFIRGDYAELRAATAAEIIAAARRAMTRRVHRGTSMSSPRAVREFLAVKLGTLEHEIFAVLLLDTRHRLIDYVELFRGTINGASVHPREVVKLALAECFAESGTKCPRLAHRSLDTVRRLRANARCGEVRPLRPSSCID